MSGFKYSWHARLIESGLPHATIVVGLAVWDDTNGKGERAFPGERRLAGRLSLSERRVRAHLDALRSAGWLVRTCRGSTAVHRKFADEYKLAMPDHRTEPSGGGGSDHRTSVTDHRTPVTGPPDSTVRPPEDAPNSKHHSAAVAAARAPRAGDDYDQPPFPDRDDGFDPKRHDIVEWITQQLGNRLTDDEVTVGNRMLAQYKHPKAVVNVIQAMRQDGLADVTAADTGGW